MKNIINKAKNLIRLGKVNPTGEGFYDVDNEIVRIEKKRGRQTISCSCKSCSRFCNEQTLCSRKLAVILFEAQDFKLKNLIRTNLETAREHKKIKTDMNPDHMINLLNDLKGFILWN